MVDDVKPREVWEALATVPEAVLCDVRTEAEWLFVGVPDLADLAKVVTMIPWQVYPSMAQNAGFVEKLAASGLTPEHRIFFICRTGGRSRAAALAAQAAGFPDCYNVADGFEGPVDPDGHRGTVAGWKAEDLPWRQR